MSITALYHLTCWLSALFDGIWIVMLLNRLAGRKLRDCCVHCLISVVPIVLATYFFYRWQRYERPLAILLLLGLVVVLILYETYISNRKWRKALVFVGIAVLAVISVTGMLISCFVLAGRHSIVGDLIGSNYRWAATYYVTHIIASAVIFVLLSVFFSVNSAYGLKKGILLFLFTVSGIISVRMLVYCTIGEGGFSLVTAVFPLIITNLCLIALYIYLQRQRQGSYEARLLAAQKRFEENRYNDANAIWENVRKVQHDIKQHLTVINGYLCEDRTKECREYLSTLLPNVERMGNLIHSDNRILDYLINSKLCAPENTQVVISGAVGDLSDIADADLACLMGNILDNAVEGTTNAEERRIELHFAKQNANRIIVCKNTVAKSVLAENCGLKSTKPQGDAHGYGTKIVAEIVAKYHGMIDYYEEFDLFCVQIILPVQKSDAS